MFKIIKIIFAAIFLFFVYALFISKAGFFTEIMRLINFLTKIKNEAAADFTIFNNIQVNNLSGLVTYLLIFITGIYVITHLVDLVIRLIKRGPSGVIHFEPKRKVKSAFHSLLFIKGILLFGKIALLITQAWGASQLFKYLFDKPVDFMNIVKEDWVFLAVLGFLFLYELLSRKSRVPEEAVIQRREIGNNIF